MSFSSVSPMTAMSLNQPDRPTRAGTSAALRFIAAARRDPELAARIAQLDIDAGLEPAIDIAGGAGFTFTAAELRAAHVHDWGLRRVRYLRAKPVPNAETTAAVVNSPSSST
jgi:hypothetical protein